MEQHVIQNITAVLNALNNISVSGKQNLGYLVGSISALEEIISALNKEDAKERCDIADGDK